MCQQFSDFSSLVQPSRPTPLTSQLVKMRACVAPCSFLRTHNMAARELNALVEEEDEDEEESDIIYTRLVANLIHVHNLLQRMTRDLPSLDAIPGK